MTQKKLGMKFALILAICLGATSAGARDWKPPTGCTPFVTVQMKQCIVGNFAKCGQGKSASYLEHYSGRSGPMTQQQTDMDGRILSVKSFDQQLLRRTEKGAKKPYSLTRLLKAGRMDWDYQSRFDTAPGPITHVGSERLNGKKLVIDGVELIGFDFEEVQTDSDGAVSNYSGQSYAVAEWHLELPGTVKYRYADGTSGKNTNTPVDLVFEGESGFMSMKPVVGCGGT